MLVLDGGRRILPGEHFSLPVPSQLQIGSTTLEITAARSSMIDLSKVSSLPASDGRIGLGTFPLQSLDLSPSSATLAHWFDALTELQRLSTASQAYLSGCTRAIIDPGGLDMAMILQWDQGQWEILASEVPVPLLGISFPVDLVERARTTGQTHFSDPRLYKTQEQTGVPRFGVAAPYFDKSRQVRGVVFAMRGEHRLNTRRGIRLLEAQFVNLIADSLTAATERASREAESVRQQLLLEQAFSQRVARRLLDDPSILEPQTREVSILFADLVDSTRLTEQLPPHEFYGLLGDLMDHWSQAVQQMDGVVLDFFGDGLAAFWNAPLDQDAHAQSACLAAMAALERLPDLNERWATHLGRPIEMRLGIHTGEALIGNSGSQRRVKYGPRGEAVHVANRIEAAAKAIGLPLVISENCEARLAAGFMRRRIARIRLPGVARPQSVFQPMMAAGASNQSNRVTGYESALADFEMGQLASAMGTLSELLTFHPDDVAVRWLMGWVQRMLQGSSDRRAEDANAVFVPLMNSDAQA